jgi:hypothetical protein
MANNYLINAFPSYVKGGKRKKKTLHKMKWNRTKHILYHDPPLFPFLSISKNQDKMMVSLELMPNVEKLKQKDG